MFEFEGDWFNATLVTAIVREYEDVKIYIHGSDEPFIVECPGDDEAIEKQKEAVEAWKAALNPQP